MAKRKITVVVNSLPRGCDERDIADYVRSALETWGGQRRPPGGNDEDDPGDPLFHSLDVASITIGGTAFYYGKG